MGLKRALIAAMLLAMGLVVATDAGLIDWTTAALAGHNDDPNDDNESPTDDEEDADEEEEVAAGKQRCKNRPNPRKCRRRKDKDKQERRNRDDGGRRDTEEPVDETDDRPAPSPTRTPQDDCDIDDDLGLIGEVLCDLLDDDSS